MSLPRGERRALRDVAAAISRSDPDLASMIAIFGVLANGAEIPALERLPGARVRAFASLLAVLAMVLGVLATVCRGVARSLAPGRPTARPGPLDSALPSSLVQVPWFWHR